MKNRQPEDNFARFTRKAYAGQGQFWFLRWLYPPGAARRPTVTGVGSNAGQTRPGVDSGAKVPTARTSVDEVGRLKELP